MSRQLLKSTGKVSSMTLLSRLLGFMRDVVFAHAFGAAAGFDAFLLPDDPHAYHRNYPPSQH